MSYKQFDYYELSERAATGFTHPANWDTQRHCGMEIAEGLYCVTGIHGRVLRCSKAKQPV
jgi:hypothetical protein